MQRWRRVDIRLQGRKQSRWQAALDGQKRDTAGYAERAGPTRGTDGLLEHNAGEHGLKHDAGSRYRNREAQVRNRKKLHKGKEGNRHEEDGEDQGSALGEPGYEAAEAAGAEVFDVNHVALHLEALQQVG